VTKNVYTWKQLVFIQLGGVVGLPLLLIGFTAGQFLAIPDGILACLIGNGILVILGLGMSRRIVERRCTTSEHMQFILGDSGKAVMAFLMASSMICWFAIQALVVGRGVFETESLQKLFSILFCLMSAFFLRKGLKGIERASFWISPVMAVIMIVGMFSVRFSVAHESSIGSAISILMGGAIFSVIDLPTFFYEAKSVGDVKKAVVVTFLVMIPLVEMSGIFLAQQGDNLVQVLSQSTGGAIVTAFIIGSGLMVNMMNLYSASKAIQGFFTSFTDTKALVVATGIGTVFTMLPVVENLETVILLMATAASACGGLLLANALFSAVPSRQCAWMALIGGICIGAIEVCVTCSLTEIPPLDGFLFSFFFITIFTKRVSHVIAS
jgi:purine-cytosine permease-like protein